MPAASPTDDPVETISQALQGTCKSLAQALEEHGLGHLEDDKDFLQGLDQEVFCCSQCDWWCEMSEMSEEHDGICTDCQPDED